MSNLANKTEYKALSIIAQTVKNFEKLHCLDMTKEDDFKARQAKNLLQGIVESGSYKVNYDQNRRKPLIKIQER